MSFEFLQACPTEQIQANHLVASLVRLPAGVNQNQQAGDDRQVHLNLHARGLGAQQVAATQKLFNHSEEQFDQPALPAGFRDQLCGNVHRVDEQTQATVAVGTFAAGPHMRCDVDFDVANRMVTRNRLAVAGVGSENNFLIDANTGIAIRRDQVSVTKDLRRAVVAGSANLAAACGVDSVEHSDLGYPRSIT